jgi:sensor domain CHASE-containing protein
MSNIQRINSPYNNIENNSTIVKIRANLKSSINSQIKLLTNINEIKQYLKNEGSNKVNINEKNIDTLKNMLKKSINSRINSMDNDAVINFISSVNNNERAEQIKLAEEAELRNESGGAKKPKRKSPAKKPKSKKSPAKKPKRKSSVKK